MLTLHARCAAILFCVGAACTAVAAQATSDNFSWTVTGLPNFAIEPGGPIQITVAVGNQSDASHIRLLQSALIDATTKLPMTNVVLCPEPSVCDPKQNPLDLRRGESARFWLVRTSGPGEYAGSVTIACDQKPAGDVVQMTVYSSSWAYRLAGVFAIFCGVAVAWILTVYLRNRLNRDQMLLPVLPLRATLRTLRAKVPQFAADIVANATATKLQQLLMDLSDESLQAHGLPRQVPAPWLPPATNSAMAFAAYVAEKCDWVIALGFVVGGLEKIFAEYSAGDVANKAAVEVAVARLDSESSSETAPKPIDIARCVDDTLTKLHADLGRRSYRGTSDSGLPSPTVQQLEIAIDRLSYGAWSLVALLTTALGAYVLIYSQSGAGFGSVGDYFKCFLWGLGLPSGATLLQSTTSSVTAAFNIVK